MGKKRKEFFGRRNFLKVAAGKRSGPSLQVPQ